MRYAAPDTASKAVALLANCSGTARVLAGGSDLLVQMKMDLLNPDLLVDIKNIPGMRAITAEAGGYRIGAAVSGAELGEHQGVISLWPGVVEAVELIGSTQVQGRATMVGNLCNASPAADSVPALICANAIASIEGPKGQRQCPVIEIATAPGKTSLGMGEFISSIFLPARAAIASDAYLRFIPRTEMDIAVVSAGVALELDAAGICRQARVAIGAVAAKVLLVEKASAALIGTTLDEAALTALGQACSDAATPIADKRGTVEFRKDVVAVLAKRAAIIAKKRAQSRAGETL